MVVQIGVIGTGAIGEQHLIAAESLPSVSIGAVCDNDAARAAWAADHFQARAFTRWQDLLAEAQVDAVVVALPHSLHAEVTRAAAAAGLHVLVEKPMATSAEDCDSMIEACEAAGVGLGVCHVLHHPQRLRKAKQMLQSGELGELLTINVRRSTHYLRTSRPRWFLERETAGGGIMFNLGAHAIDLIQWFGDSTVARVVGRTMSSDLNLSVETDGVALIELANGVPASVVTMGSGMPNADDIDLVCTKGALSSSHRNGLWLHREGGAEQLVAPEQDLADAYRMMLADFVDAVRDTRAPATDGRWGRSVVAAALQVYESQQRGGWMTVPSPVGT